MVISSGEWMNKLWPILTMEQYLATKKERAVDTWKDVGKAQNNHAGEEAREKSAQTV